VIQQRRDRTGKENEDRAQNRSERPIEPGDTDHRGGLLRELAEHLRPEVAAEFGVLCGRDRLPEELFSSLCYFFRCSFSVDLHAHGIEFLAQHSNGPEYADFDERNGDAHGFCDVVVRFLFDQGQRRHQAIFWRKLLESFSDPLAGLAADCGIRGTCAGQIFREFERRWSRSFAPKRENCRLGRIGRAPGKCARKFPP